MKNKKNIACISGVILLLLVVYNFLFIKIDNQRVYRYTEKFRITKECDEKDFKKVASIIKPKTKGKKISPFSSRNLNGDEKVKYEIPKEELDKYSDILKDLELGDKLKFTKTTIKNFDKIVVKVKGKDYNINEERNLSGLSSKEFIHSIGMWNEFIKFTKQEYKHFKEVTNA